MNGIIINDKQYIFLEDLNKDLCEACEECDLKAIASSPFSSCSSFCQEFCNLTNTKHPNYCYFKELKIEK